MASFSIQEKIELLLEQIRHLNLEVSIENHDEKMIQIQAQLKHLHEEIKGLEYQENREDDLEYQYQKEEEQDIAEDANQRLEDQYDKTRDVLEKGVKSVPSTKPLTPEQLLALKKTMDLQKNFSVENNEKTIQEFETSLRDIRAQVQLKSQAGKDLGELKNQRGDASLAFRKNDSGSFAKLSEDPSLLMKNNPLAGFAPPVPSMGGRASKDEADENVSSLYYHSTPTPRPSA